MTVILAIALLALPNPRVLLSQTFAEAQAIDPLIPELMSKVQNMKGSGVVVKLNGNIRVFIAVSATKTAVIARISEDCEVPVGLMEELAGRIAAEFDASGNTEEMRYNFAKKRDLRAKIEEFVKEFEEKAAKAPGFKRINEEISKINVEMQRNVDKMLIQQDNLLKIEHKTEKMSELASKFKEKAIDLSEKESEGECSLGFKIFMGVLMAVLFAIVIIIVAYYSDNDYSDESTTTSAISSNSTIASINATEHFTALKTSFFP